MKLTFIYVPVPDLPPALAFYRDQLGLDEAWREGEGTVAFGLPSSDVQIMVDVPLDDGPNWASGPMYLVDDLDAYMKDHAAMPHVGDVIADPNIRFATYTDPAGNPFHVFELVGDAEE